MKSNLLRSLAVSIVMMMSAIVYAQDAANPWHLTANENAKEVAFYNTQVITGVTKATAQTVMVALNTGKQFSHPIATVFKFSPRKGGTGTANEMITVPQWNVYYANGKLNFSEAVNNVAVYSFMGTLVARFTGNNYTEVSVILGKGLYIVQAGNQTAKLVVREDGFGGGSTVVQPKVEQQAIAYAEPEVSLRAGSEINQYMNITAGSTTISVKMSEAEGFHFTANDSIVVIMKNGTTVQLADYKGVTFTSEPATATNSNIDWNSISLYCGAGYDQDGNVYYSIATKTEFWIYDAKNNKTTKIAKSSIRQNVIDNPSKLPNGSTIEGSGHVGVFTSNGNTVVCMGMVYRRKAIYNDGSSEYGYVNYDFINDKSIFYPERIFSFNNNRWIIPATISADANGTITVSTDVGKHTF